MPRHPDVRAGAPRLADRRGQACLDWSRLLASGAVLDALEAVALWLGPGVVELTLEAGRLGRTVLTAAGAPRAIATRASATVGRRPAWRLSLGVAKGFEPEARGWADRGALALEAWRYAREALRQSEHRLTARSRELDLLQGVGRRAAEARDLPGLFAAALTAISQGLELDLALAAWVEGVGARVELFAARPLAEGYVEHLEQRALGFLGLAGAEIERRSSRLEGWDAARGPRREFREEDLVLLPLMRRAQPTACLAIVPSGGADESRLRMIYSAGNQLALHLDRILTVREAEADRFRSIVESMPQGVLLADKKLRLIQANSSAVRLLEAAGLEPAGDLRSSLDRLRLTPLVEQVFRGEGGSAEGEACFEDGRVWSVTVAPLHGERRRTDGVVLVVADVTDSRRLQEQLAQSEKMSSLGQMISGVAHELNNPLASILGYSQLLRIKGSDDRLPERLDVLAREAERCRKIVQNLLSFARRREPERRPLSLNQVARDVEALLAYQLRVDDVSLELDLSAELPVIHGDPHQLEQMLVNLVTNARHAIRDARRPGVIRVRTRPQGGTDVRLEVIDSGPGIPAEIRSRIFDPFFTTKRPGRGTGLGLALVYSIVTRHGGEIETTAAEEGGTVFRIRLPRGSATADEGETRRRDAVVDRPARRGRILVVDDELPLTRLICDVLEQDGHTTCGVVDGRQALARLAAEEFDLIVSDLKMPGMDGARLHEELARTRPGLARRMLLTTGDTVGPAPAAEASGTGLDVLTKPFDLADLRRRVHARLASDGEASVERR